MTYLIIFGLIMLYFVSLVFRGIVNHPFRTLYYGLIDGYKYFRYCRWREAPAGELNCYAALFGRGKTLSMTLTAVKLYKRYNNKKVYDFNLHRWVTQKVVFLSNYELLSVPMIHLENMNQYVKLLKGLAGYDAANGTRTYVYLLGDEFSVQMNSRNFKSNLDPNVLNSILTCRHYHSSIYYTSQRFALTDKLMRDVTQYVVYCKKLWRFQRQYIYDAYELENAANPELVKPLRRRVLFIDNSVFKAYDTLACVENLERSAFEGDMISELEQLQLRAGETDLEQVTHLSRKGKKKIS